MPRVGLDVDGRRTPHDSFGAIGQIRRIVSLPAAMAAAFHELEDRPASLWHATCDPGRPLGSGGGTANALLSAWVASDVPTFDDWIRSARSLVVHAGGQSRRLPAYAAVGKALMPIPALRGSKGQRPDQALIDLQTDLCDSLFDLAPECLRTMVVSGDVLIRPDRLPASIPDADVVCFGMRADLHVARNFGVFFVRHGEAGVPAFFMQKPDVAQAMELSSRYECLLDIGIWLLSERAVAVLVEKAGCEVANLRSQPAFPYERLESPTTFLEPYELYNEFGLSLGTEPTVPDEAIGALSCAVVPITGTFLHFGTSRQLIESVTRLHDQAIQQSPLGFVTSAKRHPDQHVQNAWFDGAPPFVPGQPYWVESSRVPSRWTLLGENVVTGAPDNDWALELPQGACLDFVPIQGGGLCLRAYGIDDPFKGAIGEPSTLFMGRPLSEWLAARGLTIADLGSADTDIQNAPLFPLLTPLEAVGGRRLADGSGALVPQPEDCTPLVQWMVSVDPSEDLSNAWRTVRRLSASDIMRLADVGAIYRRRGELLARSLDRMQHNHQASIFYNLDLERCAAILHRYRPGYLPAERLEDGESMVKRMHDGMYRADLLRLRYDERWREEEQSAFDALRQAIVESVCAPAKPTCGVAPDQIVWGRSPLRFDLAGGWTDTPPYCLLHGGRVLNVAVDLNGQPPVQVYLRLSERPDVLLRSIDLGTERRFATFEELSTSLGAKSEFALAQAALGIAGFGPNGGAGSLKALMESFGGGIEMSLLAAVPKGSGLGTSSILAATILAALNQFCRLGWSQNDVLARTMAMEQILGTGGGWQDQVGGALPGMKDLETQAGIRQSPECRWLPDFVLGPEYANRTALLYYTGITRMAKGVLAEIVRGMFLNSGPRLATLRRIRENVVPTAEAVQRRDYEAFARCVGTTWALKQALDSGTNTPPVRSILSKVEDYLLGTTLLGAGGGGFLLMLTKDPEAAVRVRTILESDPPSAKARFFDFRVSQVGLEVTRS